jgi:hypothetical protein
MNGREWTRFFFGDVLFWGGGILGERGGRGAPSTSLRAGCSPLPVVGGARLYGGGKACKGWGSVYIYHNY